MNDFWLSCGRHLTDRDAVCRIMRRATGVGAICPTRRLTSPPANEVLRMKPRTLLNGLPARRLAALT